MIKREDLQYIADEFNKVFFHPDPQINTDLPNNELAVLVKEAFQFKAPGDIFTERTQKIWKDLEDNVAIDPGENELVTSIKDAQKVSDLKEIIKANDVFKPLRNNLSSYRIAADLRDLMLKIINGEPIETGKTDDQLQQETAQKLHEKNIASAPVQVGDAPVEKEKGPYTPVIEPIQKFVEISAIVISEALSKLFPIDPTVRAAILDHMRENGYDASFPVIVWDTGKALILVDGHTRLQAAQELGYDVVPVEKKTFSSEQDALMYALHNQRDRRNMSDAEILNVVAILDEKMSHAEAGRKGARKKAGEKVEKTEASHKKIAKVAGVGSRKVSEARTVLADEDATNAVKSGEKTIHAAATEIVAKKRGRKPKSEAAPAPAPTETAGSPTVKITTRIQATVEIIKINRGSSIAFNEIVEASDILFETEAGGVSNMDSAGQITDYVILVMEALNLVKKTPANIVQIYNF